MRGKKKRRVSVRHISPRWSRVLNSERRATSGWDPPLRASLPSLCRPPPSTFPSSRVRFVCYERQLRRHASKQIRSYRLLRFVSSDLHVKGTLSCAFPRSLLHQLERAEIREMACRMAIRCSPTPICHDCSSSTMLIPETWTYIRFNSIGIWPFLFLSYFPTATFDTMRLLRITLRPRLQLIKRSGMRASTHLGCDRGIVEVRTISRSGR